MSSHFSHRVVSPNTRDISISHLRITARNFDHPLWYPLLVSRETLCLWQKRYSADNRKDSAWNQWLNVMPQNKQVFFEGCTYNITDIARCNSC